MMRRAQAASAAIRRATNLDPRQYRYSLCDSTSISRFNVTYGITANNNPIVQVRGTRRRLPAFPYAASTVARTPGQAPSSMAPLRRMWQRRRLRLIDDVLYLEASAYRTRFQGPERSGTNPFGATRLFDAAPYWRVAFEPHWGNDWLVVGTFGMILDVPSVDHAGNVDDHDFSRTDKFADIASIRNSRIGATIVGHAARHLCPRYRNSTPASRAGAANLTNTLNDPHAYASLAYGGGRVVLTGQYLDTWGSPHPILYAGLASGFGPTAPAGSANRLRPVRQEFFAGMAVVQRARRVAIHLVRQVRRHHRRREG